MATAIQVQLQDVNKPRHLAAFPFADGTNLGRVKMEVYTGWVVVNFNVGNTLDHADVKTFVPLDPNTIQPYGEEDIIGVTVTAAPSSVDVVSTGGTAAVDEASVKLEPQVGAQCLVLRAKLAAAKAHLIAFTYQVTVLTKADKGLPAPISPGPTATPTA
jgi:hypothetical protein